MDKSISIVVFYESTEVKSLIEEVLGSQLQQVFFSNIKKEQKEFVTFASKQHQSFLFIYAFDDPKFATELLQLLHKHDSLADVMKIPHISILFCSREYRKRAYSECINKRFFFYETIRPVYDMNRVRLLLNIASDSLVQKIQFRRVLAENEVMRSNLNEVSFHLEGIEGSIADEKGIQGALLDDLMGEVNKQDDELNEVSSQTSLIKQGLDEFKDYNQGYFNSLGEQVKTARPKIEKNEPLVLVADDQKMMLKIISTILKPKGFQVETAVNGAEVLMKAKISKPQIILLDIDMPILNGIDTLKAFKKEDDLKDIPIIMLTSNSDKHSFMECLELGAIDYIVKPTNAEILLKKILAVI